MTRYLLVCDRRTTVNVLLFCWSYKTKTKIKICFTVISIMAIMHRFGIEETCLISTLWVPRYIQQPKEIYANIYLYISNLKSQICQIPWNNKNMIIEGLWRLESIWEVLIQAIITSTTYIITCFESKMAAKKQEVVFTWFWTVDYSISITDWLQINIADWRFHVGSQILHPSGNINSTHSNLCVLP